MLLLVPGLLATSVLLLTGVRQLAVFQRGQVRDLWALSLAVLGLLLATSVVVIGFEINGGRPTTGLMGTLLGALLLCLILGTSLSQPVNMLLIGVAPLTAVFTLLASIGASADEVQPLSFKTALHVIASIAAYGAVAFAGTLSLFLSWHHRLLKQRPLSAWIAALPALDAMESLFLRAVQAAWITLSIALLTGVLYVDDFWAQHVAHKTVLSVLAWIGMSMALWQHYQDGGVTRIMRKTAVWAAVLVCAGYLGSKAIVEFILA